MEGKPLRRRTLIAGSALKLGVILSCTAGILLQLAGGGGAMGDTTSIFLYFTIQSNIWIALVCLGFLLYDLLRRGRRRFGAPPYILKFMCTGAILLTFFVFAVLLAPIMPKSYLLSPSNMLLHDVTPLLALADFVLCDDGYAGETRHTLFGAILPLAYAVFALSLSFGGVRFNGAAVPYFFLNYEKLGWFTIGKNGIGVVWWTVILTALVMLIGFALLRIRVYRRRKRAAAAGAPRP